MKKLALGIALLLAMLLPAVAFWHGTGCGGSNLLLGASCSDFLATGGSVRLTAN